MKECYIYEMLYWWSKDEINKHTTLKLGQWIHINGITEFVYNIVGIKSNGDIVVNALRETGYKYNNVVTYGGLFVSHDGYLLSKEYFVDNVCYVLNKFNTYINIKEADTL